MKKVYLILFFTILFSLFIGCKKYEKGPSLSFRSVKKRLSGSWYESRSFNEIVIKFNQLETAKTPQGDYKIYILPDTFVLHSGLWETTKDKKNIVLYKINEYVDQGWYNAYFLDSPIFWTNSGNNLEKHDTLKILKLTNEELWLNYNSSSSDLKLSKR